MRKDRSQLPQGINAPITTLFYAIIVPCCFFNSISFSLSQNSAPFNFRSSLRIVNLRSLEEVLWPVLKVLYVLSNIYKPEVYWPIAERKVCQVKLTEWWGELLLHCLKYHLVVLFLSLSPWAALCWDFERLLSPSLGLVRGRLLNKWYGEERLLRHLNQMLYCSGSTLQRTFRFSGKHKLACTQLSWAPWPRKSGHSSNRRVKTPQSHASYPARACAPWLCESMTSKPGQAKGPPSPVLPVAGLWGRTMAAFVWSFSKL